MDPMLQSIVEKVRQDSGSGAADILRDVLDSLSDAMEQLARLEASDLRHFSIQLHLAKRSMAPLFNLANRILLSLEAEDWRSTLMGEVLAIRAERDLGQARLVGNIRQTVGGKRIMTISYSSTVLAGLVQMGRVDLEVIVPLSLPLGEGRKMATALVDQGLRAELIQDSMVFSVMEEVDLVLVGADAVCPRGVVNKVGTFSLAAAAERFGLPSYAVCDWMKVAAIDLLDPVETQTLLGRGLTMRDQVFEMTPLELFTGIVTDRGAMGPEVIRSGMKSMPISGQWSAP